MQWAAVLDHDIQNSLLPSEKAATRLRDRGARTTADAGRGREERRRCRKSPIRGPSVEEVDGVAAQRHGFDEVILHVDGTTGRVGLPVATVADKRFDRRVKELRMYYSSWPLTGRHATRPTLLQPDPELRASDVVADYQDALASGDVDAIVWSGSAPSRPSSCSLPSAWYRPSAFLSPGAMGGLQGQDEMALARQLGRGGRLGAVASLDLGFRGSVRDVGLELNENCRVLLLP